MGKYLTLCPYDTFALLRNLLASCTGYTHAVFSCLDPQNTGRVTFEVLAFETYSFQTILLSYLNFKCQLRNMRACWLFCREEVRSSAGPGYLYLLHIFNPYFEWRKVCTPRLNIFLKKLLRATFHIFRCLICTTLIRKASWGERR